MKPLVIIIGMHRSGTSFLTRSLNLSGVNLGEIESLSSHEWDYLDDNPRGHWENKEIMNLTEITLQKNHGSWDNIPSHIEIDELLGEKIQNYLNKLSKEPSLAYGFKDPRATVCFESWKKYLPSNFVLIGIFRDPLKVAESLKKRNGFDYEKSLNLWTIYNKQLLELLEKYNGFLINFDQPKEKIISEIKLVTSKLGLLNPTKLSDWYTEDLLHSDQSFKKDFELDPKIKTLHSKLIERSKNNNKVNFKNIGKIDKERLDLVSSIISQSYDQSKEFRKKIESDRNEIYEKKERLEQLQKEFDEKAQWAKNLDSESQKKGELIKKLQKEIDEKAQWAKNLDSESQKKDEIINNLGKEVDEQTKWAQKLDSESQKKDKNIIDLRKELDDSSEIISTKNSQIDEIQSQYFETSTELNNIKGSTIFRLTKRFTNFIDKVFPPSTKRGESIRLLKMAGLTYKNEGYQGLSLATKQKFFYKKSVKLDNHTKKLSINFKENEIDGGVFIPKTYKFSTDPFIRKFLTYNYGNFTNLSYYPKISIIILTYNQTLLLKKNIENILNKTTYSNYEIIVVTNNTDQNSDMWKLLKTLDCKSYMYEDEYSFSKMNNFGASKATGEFLIILNDDVEIVSGNWIESFLKLAEDESVGAIGAKLLFSDGRLQEAGCIFWRNGNAWNYGRGKDPKSPEFNYVRNIDYCSCSCLFVKRDIFDKIGGFDSSYHPAYAEDAELCFSIRNQGYQVLYQPLVEVIHHEGMTQGTKTSGGIKSYQIKNLQKFSKKWKNVLDTYREDSTVNSFFERNRKDGLNILYVDHYIPEPDRDSGSLRTFRFLGILSHLNHKVTFWPDNLNQSQPYTSELQQKGVEVIFGSNNFGKFLDERKDLYDIAIISRPHIAPKYLDTIRAKMPHCIIIYDTVDLHFLRMTRQSQLDDTASKSELEKTRDIELSLMDNSDLTLLTSEEEAKFLHPDNPQLRFVVLPNIHIFDGKIPGFDSRENMMFIGNFQHPPNVDSATYLLEEIFPKIQDKLPEIQLYVIGPNPPESIKKYQSDSVHVLGYVKNIDEYFSKCRLALSPLRFGAGVKGKITQSLTRGLPSITTTVGAEGIELTDSKDCMIADDAQSFADKAIALYTDSSLWEKISANGLKSAQFCSAESIKNTIESLFSAFRVS